MGWCPLALVWPNVLERSGLRYLRHAADKEETMINLLKIADHEQTMMPIKFKGA